MKDILIMDLVLRDMKVKKSALDTFSTSVFRTKVEFTDKIFDDNPALYGTIIAENPRIRRIIEAYRKHLLGLQDLLAKKDRKALVDLIAKKS